MATKAKAAAKRAAKPAPRKPAASVKRTAPAKARRQPETLRLRAATVGVTVDDLGKSLDFYCDLLGFVIAERFERDGELRGARLRAGACDLYVAQDDWKKGKKRVKGLAIRSYYETVQDIDQLAKRVRARGGKLTQEPMDQPWGVRDFSLTDPDGFQITLFRNL